MHALAATLSIRGYQLDLVYLNATLQAAGHNDLARPVQDKISALKHQRAELERAEELEVVASAAVAGRDLTLEEIFKNAAAHVKAHHPEDYDHFFPKRASSVTESALRAEIQAVRTLATNFSTLPADDATRVEFTPKLTRGAEELEQAITQKDTVLQNFALVRNSLDRVRAEVNALRLETHAQLVHRTHDKKVADHFFRAATKKHADHAAPTPSAPAAPTASHA
jgi:hypothetical protein